MQRRTPASRRTDELASAGWLTKAWLRVCVCIYIYRERERETGSTAPNMQGPHQCTIEHFWALQDGDAQLLCCSEKLLASHASTA